MFRPGTCAETCCTSRPASRRRRGRRRHPGWPGAAGRPAGQYRNRGRRHEPTRERRSTRSGNRREPAVGNCPFRADGIRGAHEHVKNACQRLGRPARRIGDARDQRHPHRARHDPDRRLRQHPADRRRSVALGPAAAWAVRSLADSVPGSQDRHDAIRGLPARRSRPQPGWHGARGNHHLPALHAGQEESLCVDPAQARADLLAVAAHRQANARPALAERVQRPVGASHGPGGEYASGRQARQSRCSRPARRGGGGNGPAGRGNGRPGRAEPEPGWPRRDHLGHRSGPAR